ncbi:unnamed protein product [Bathycoccus prasinos]
MFLSASAFNHDISSWTGSAATTAQTGMFTSATAFQAKFTCDDANTGEFDNRPPHQRSGVCWGASESIRCFWDCSGPRKPPKALSTLLDGTDTGIAYDNPAEVGTVPFVIRAPTDITTIRITISSTFIRAWLENPSRWRGSPERNCK